MLGALVYSTSDAIYERDSRSATLRRVDFIASFLSVVSVVPLLAGLSLAGVTYDWSDWRIITLITIGGVCLVLFVFREAHPALPWSLTLDPSSDPKQLLGLRHLDRFQVLDVCVGAVLLGIIVRTPHPPLL